MKISITPKDMKRGKTITPGWYQFKISNVTTRPAKTDGSTNYFVELTGKDGEAEDVVINDVYSEKFLVRMVPLLLALGVEVDEDVGIDADISGIVGREVNGHVENDSYQNRLVNKISDYSKV